MKGSVYKRGKSWYYHVDLGKDSITGKRRRKTKGGFKTKREALEALNKINYELSKGIYIEPSKMLYGDYFKEWLNNRKYNLNSQTYKGYESYARNHILPILGHIPLVNLTPIAIENFITILRDKGLSNESVKRIYSVVNASLNDAVRKELLAKNVASLIEKPKGSRKEIQVWDVEQVQRFLQVADGDRLYIAFHLALMTGMRQGEILGLRWTDIDFNTKTIYVRQTLTHDGKEFQEKTKTLLSTRPVAIDDETINALLRQKEVIARDKERAKDSYVNHNLVVCTSKGTPVNPRNVLRSLERLIAKANVPKITFHDLRHTHATLLLKQNVHPKIVSERLGHSTVKMTLDLYSHLLPNMQEEASKNLSKVIFSDQKNEFVSNLSSSEESDDFPHP